MILLDTNVVSELMRKSTDLGTCTARARTAKLLALLR